MNTIVYCATSVLSLAAIAQSSFSQGNVRYYDDVFQNVIKTADITYGQNKTVSGSNYVLKLDVYEPAGDTAVKRPVVIFGHGGTFISGSKTDYDVATLCDRFSKKGYVTISYNYRIGIGFPINQSSASKAVYRATQDAKAVVRFIYKDAATVNNYKIDTNQIYLGGSSAGAFIALHYAYLDDPAELPAYLDTTGLGDMEGNSGNQGYSSIIHGAINLSGALGDTAWMKPGDEPLCSMHGTNDQTVPYGSGMIYISGFPIMEVDGSSSVHFHAEELALTNSFYTWQGADHTPYASSQAYMDTTVDYIRDFLCTQTQLCTATPPGFPERESSTKLFYINDDHINNRILITTVPGSSGFSVNISDVTGKNIMRYTSGNRMVSINTNGMSSGMYMIHLATDDGRQQAEKILIR